MGLNNPQAADHLAAEAGSFEPQRANNFSVEIALTAGDKDLIIMGLEGFSLPSVTNESIELSYQNEKRKVAGQTTVEDANLVLKDFCDKDVRGALLRWRKQVYDPATGKIGLAKDYKKQLQVIMVGPNGEYERVAKLKGCWPTADPPADLNMESAEKLLMEVPISVDKISWADSITGA